MLKNQLLQLQVFRRKNNKVLIDDADAKLLESGKRRAEDNLQKIEVEIRHEKKYSNLYITI
ncbi:hypothetical protein BDE36_4084 [Arcticibacter tournemirensis]|nr:hypothetical protein BDE36_4084 [Arcticibacter tournemirensis]